jgi:predicted permease
MRQAVRSLARTPNFTLTAVVLLAIGIGTNVAVFTFIDALFLQRLNVPESDRLVGIHGERARKLCTYCISYPDYLLHAATTKSLSAVALYDAPVWVWDTQGENSRELFGAAVTSNFLDVMRVRPRMGRFFTAEENRAPNAHPVAVLSEHVWRERFAGDPQVLGRVVRFNRLAFTIIGVAPAAIEHIYSSQRIDVWVPLMMAPMGKADTKQFERARFGGFDLVGRLAPGATIEQTRAELKTVAARSAAEFPETNRDESIALVPLRGAGPLEQADAKRTVIVLSAVALALLIITCTNIAGLLMSRAIARQKEFAIRHAIGASRPALVRQLLVESLVLAMPAAALGTACGYLLSSTVSTTRFTPAAAVVSLLAALAAAVLFGLLPALFASGRTAEAGLKVHAASGHRSRLRGSLVVAQVALAVVLLTGAGLLLESLGRFLSQAGPSGDQIVAFRLRPSRIGYAQERGERFNRALLSRITATPGVESAMLARVGPSRGWCCPIPVRLPDTTGVNPSEIENNDVTPGFFAALGIPLVAGRDFDDRDRMDAPRTVIVSQTLARHLWGERDPIGRILLIRDAPHTVIGVARDVHPSRFGEGPVPYLYRSYWQLGGPDSRLFVRVGADATTMINVLRREILALDPDMHIGQESTLRQTVERTAHFQKLISQLLAFCGTMAAVLTSIGLYATLVFAVGQRRRELAIRSAVGARESAIFALILRGGAKLVITGVIIGVAAALALSQVVASYLYGVNPINVRTYLLAAGLLATLAMLACLAPARTATRVQPIEALKAE